MQRLGRYFVCLLILALALTVPAIAEAPSDTSADTAADEEAIHALIESWSAASEAKDADAFVAVYADDAVLMMEGVSNLVGKEAIHAAMVGMMQDPHFSLVFDPKQVVVAASGDLAYETGAYTLSASDAQGNQVTQHGQYVVVSEK